VFILSNFITAVAQVLSIILNIFMWLIVIRAIASWFTMDPYNPIYQFLIRITEPVLGYIRRVLPMRGSMMDLSPIVAILAIVFLQSFLVQTLFGLAVKLR
jgi:YggT family protein